LSIEDCLLVIESTAATQVLGLAFAVETDFPSPDSESGFHQGLNASGGQQLRPDDEPEPTSSLHQLFQNHIHLVREVSAAFLDPGLVIIGRRAGAPALRTNSRQVGTCWPRRVPGRASTTLPIRAAKHHSRSESSFGVIRRHSSITNDRFSMLNFQFT
jgi:hypothetical protein